MKFLDGDVCHGHFYSLLNICVFDEILTTWLGRLVAIKTKAIDIVYFTS